MNMSLIIGLTRARVALIAMGLAWVVGLQAPLPVRLTIVGLIVAALVFDGLLDEQRLARTARTPTADRHHTTT